MDPPWRNGANPLSWRNPIFTPVRQRQERNGAIMPALRSQIHKRTPVQPAHFRFLHLELREDPVPFCVVEARAA